MISLIPRKTMSRAARRAISILVCAILVAAGLLDFRSHAVHSVHAGHQHDIQAQAAPALGLGIAGTLNNIEHTSDYGHAAAGDAGSAVDRHDGEGPVDDDGPDSCGAHNCLTAIVLAATKLTATPRYLPSGAIHDAIQASFDARGLYRPPISLL